ncbi:hypothetical protein FRB90_012227 [Tulasnella sp. 427]|nr:hypothetical protein FRB90_012227 [Tulasnella sp. 427]
MTDLYTRGEDQPAVDLPYDDASAAEAEKKKSSSLLSRIGRSRVYALEDSSAGMFSRLSKRKRDVLLDTEEDKGDADAGDQMDTDAVTRDNAITLSGTPIADLPTAKIFAYAGHFADPPNAVEWINDTTVVLIYGGNKSARRAFKALMQDERDVPDTTVECTAHGVPSVLWPAQLRVNLLLDEGDAKGLKETISIRWALKTDVKQKGAASQSKFYKTYGEQAGKEGRPVWDGAASGSSGRRDPKRGRMSDWDGDRKERRRDDGENGGRTRGGVTKDDLDAELDAFLKDRGED